MFANIKSQTAGIQNKDEILLEERMRFRDLYILILQHAITSGALIGGELGLHLDTIPNTADQIELLLTDLPLEIYCENINEFVKINEELTKLLKNTLHYIELKIIISDAGSILNATIRLDNRDLAILYKLSEGFKLLPLYTQWANKITLPPLAYMLEITRYLYQPNVSEWPRMLNRFIKIMDITDTKSLITGADDETENMYDDPLLNKLNIMKKFIANSDKIMLLGVHALRILTKSKITIRGPLHVLCDNEYFKQISEYIGGSIVKTSRQIFQDRRLVRYSIRKNNTDLIFNYNSLKYELIGFSKYVDKTGDIIRIANIFAIIRFILIDYWILVEKYKAQKISLALYERRTDEIIKLMQLSKTYTIPDFNDYMGQYESDERYQKMKYTKRK